MQLQLYLSLALVIGASLWSSGNHRLWMILYNVAHSLFTVYVVASSFSFCSFCCIVSEMMAALADKVARANDGDCDQKSLTQRSNCTIDAWRMQHTRTCQLVDKLDAFYGPALLVLTLCSFVMTINTSFNIMLSLSGTSRAADLGRWPNVFMLFVTFVIYFPAVYGPHRMTQSVGIHITHS